jgi:hypothetical protein
MVSEILDSPPLVAPYSDLLKNQEAGLVKLSASSTDWKKVPADIYIVASYNIKGTLYNH